MSEFLSLYKRHKFLFLLAIGSKILPMLYYTLFLWRLPPPPFWPSWKKYRAEVEPVAPVWKPRSKYRRRLPRAAAVWPSRRSKYALQYKITMRNWVGVNEYMRHMVGWKILLEGFFLLSFFNDEGLIAREGGKEAIKVCFF